MVGSRSGARSNPSWAARRTARSMRSGSSENVTSAGRGVRRRRRSRSARPPSGSCMRPSKSISIALTVKSRRSRSSSTEAGRTNGLRESGA
ncbi:MAG: hypothetical protein AUI15_13590 [Actinobacteria bacterium 13_2_20CM_2_66_6]|nr:MAG: hypothetical protein AUI15_13590 [Actinobacteria bacterium 13_2_20CM_2_66_6]